MPTAITSQAITRARRLRRDMTEGERRLWLELREFRRRHGVHVRRQAPIGVYVADFAVHERGLVIEVDGEHHFRPRQMVKDRSRDAWFASQGYEVIRFNTGELADSFDGCVEEIVGELGLMVDDQDTPTPTPSPQGGRGLGHPLIRPATVADLDACAEIINDYIDATDWLPRVHPRETIAGFFTPELLERRKVLVVEMDGSVVGYLTMSTEGMIPALYLSPAARGRGIGKALLDRAKAQSPGQVELTVFEPNLAARRFYEREGFVEVPEERKIEEEGIPIFLMRWSSSSPTGAQP